MAAGKDLLGALLEAQNDMGEGLLVAEDGRVSHANEAFSSVSDYTMPELVALPALSELFVPEHRQTVVDLMRRHARGEAIADRRETAVFRKSGGRVGVEVVFKSLCGDDEPLPT